MENKRLKALSIAALIVSILPLATFIPIILKITLPSGMQGLWGGANILFVLVGLCLSIICVKSKESRSVVNIIAVIINIFWVLLMGGIVALALILNFMQ